MPSLLCRCCSWFATALPVLAQAVTVPAVMNGVEGGTASSIPFGTNQAARYQCIYDAAELPWSGPRVVTTVSLRADNTDPGTTSFAAKGFVVVSLFLGTTAVRAENSSSQFADNHGSDLVGVLGNVPLMLPAQPPQAGVRTANIDLVLPTPWIYGLTPVRNNGNPPPGSLLIELWIHSQPTGTYRLDNIGGCASPTTSFGQVGQACALVPGAPPLTLTPGTSLQAGSSFTWHVDNAQPNAAVLLLLNLSNQGLLFGQPSMPVPYPLFDPSNPLLPPPALAAYLPTIAYGAPDCWLNLVPAATLMAVADTTGAANFVVGVAAGRQLVGMSLYAQAAAYAQTANPLLLITSEGRQTTVCGPLGVARIYSFGSTTATAGQRSVGQGPVIELR